MARQSIAAQSDERAMIEELEFKRPQSRLSCRIELSRVLDGLQMSLAPDELVRAGEYLKALGSAMNVTEASQP